MGEWAGLGVGFFRRSPEVVAVDLLGRYLVRELDGELLALRVVEVEAYLGAGDRAAHTFGGRRTARVRSMYLGGGHAYVYRIYGLHDCINVVVGEVDSGQAVLLRAGEVVAGEATMRRLRGLPEGAEPIKAGQLAGGPGRLCQALAIDRSLDGASLLGGTLRLAHGRPVPESEVVRGPRVGVDSAGEAAHWPLRYAVGESREVTRRSALTPSWRRT